MSALTREALFDSSLRLAQGGLVVDAAIQGAFRGLRQHQDTNRNSVYRLADRLGQARREASAVEVEADALAGEAAELRLLLAAALQRADRAEARADRAEAAVIAAARRQGLV